MKLKAKTKHHSRNISRYLCKTDCIQGAHTRDVTRWRCPAHEGYRICCHALKSIHTGRDSTMRRDFSIFTDR